MGGFIMYNQKTGINYTISPGDNLYNLAKYYHTTVEDIRHLNIGIDPNYLQVGQTIFIIPNYSYVHDLTKSIDDFAKQMRLVWVEHVVWTRLFIISTIEKLGDLEETTARLLRNPKDIANLFRPYYGQAVADTIEKLIKEHLLIAANLVNALIRNDTATAEKEDKKWYKNADDIALAFSQINPYFRYDEMRKMLYEHLDLTKQEVAFRLAKNYREEIKAFDKIVDQAIHMAHSFVFGLARQFPDHFSR